VTSAHEHVELFNRSVTSGDWGEFLTLFHPDAVMTFEGVPAGPYVGREVIAEAYRTSPPTDTMTIRSVTGDRVDFVWSRGSTGSMTIHRRDGLITDLAVVFD
jgi:steroid Delta-isomerase